MDFGNRGHVKALAKFSQWHVRILANGILQRFALRANPCLRGLERYSGEESTVSKSMLGNRQLGYASQAAVLLLWVGVPLSVNCT